MKLLLVAATKLEIEPAIHHFGLETGLISSRDHDIKLLITGVGMVATAYALGKELAGSTYDLAINVGIAGSFEPSILNGDVVLVNEDYFSDLGAENKDHFLAIDEMGFGQSKIIPIKHKQINFPGFKHVKSITVNTVHGNKKSIENVVRRLNPQIETMEGAAFFYACNDAGLPSVQLRAISNVVEERNTSNWKIHLAVKNLNDRLIELIEAI